MFKTRLISGIVLVALALALIITGGNILLISTAVIALIGMFELYRIFHIERTIAGIAGFLAAVLFYCNLKFAFIPDTMMFVIGFLVVLMFIYVFSYPKYHTEQMLAAFFGVFYVAVMLSYIYQTRMLPQGAYTVWLIFLCSWGCDTCAYCVGMLIGKHKMTPKLSPKKSWEGFFGGVVAAVAVGALMGLWQDASPVLWAGAGLVISVSGVYGDLVESMLKRSVNLKDSGHIIPGHGGLLDRFDALLLAVPFAFVYLVIFA